MSLNFAECLKEARSIPTFTGTDDYNITSYLRDLETVLSLTDLEHQPIIKKILCNKVRGKALACVETLIEPTFDDILSKLKEEFGIKKSFINLRNEASNVIALNIEDLNNKLSNVLRQMNSKYFIEGASEALYNPNNNEKLIFDVFLSFLPCHFKTLLIQNSISTMSKAYSYFVENNLLSDVALNNQQTKSTVVKPQFTADHRQNNNLSN